MPLTEVTSLVVVSSMDITYEDFLLGHLVRINLHYLLFKSTIFQLQTPYAINVGGKPVVQVSELPFLLCPGYLSW